MVNKMNNNTQNTNNGYEYLSLASLFKMFNRKNILKTLLITMFLVFLGLLYSFFATPKYTSHTQIKLDINDAQRNTNQDTDLIQNLHTSNISNVETELDVLHSDLLLSKVLSRVSDNIKYFQVGHLRKTEYYKNTPILLHDVKVFSKKVFAQLFYVTPVDEKHFKLRLKDGLILPSPYNKEVGNKIYKYNQIIKSKDFSFSVENIHAKVGEEYAFIIMYEPLALEEVYKNLDVRPASADSSVVDMFYEDVNPIRAKEFLEYLTEDYIELNIESKTKTTSSILKFLDQQIKSVKDKLLNSSNSLKDFKKNNKLISIDTKSQEIVDKMIQTHRDLEETKVAYKSFMILKKALDRGDYSSVGAFSNEYEILGTLITNLETAKADKDALLANFTSKHPDVIVANRRIRNIQRSIKSVADSIEKNLRKRIASIENILKKDDEQLKQLPSSEQKLASLERVYRVNEELYSYLLQRRSELNLLKASKVSDVQVIGKPSMPLKPTKPNKKLIIILTTFLGLITAFILSMLKFHKKIKSVDDIKAKTDIPIYGIIPYIEDENSYNKAYVLDDPNSPAAEAFRSIRANLEYSTPDSNGNKAKTVLVTSSIPHEGKTVVSANLAAIIGMSEKKVLILGCDLRRPQLHNKFSLPNKKGLSDLLSNKVSLNDVIWEHAKYKNFHIITSGKIPPNPAELLSSKKMNELMDDLASKYDYIILDTPPINYVSDAMVLFKYSDLNIFVVKSDFTDEKYIDGINSLAEGLNLESNGIILNSVKKAHNTMEQFDKKYIYHDTIERQKVYVN